MIRDSYRIDCTGCGWSGYRVNVYGCECYSDYAYYCKPTDPGPGCPSGANLRAWCPRCRNYSVSIEKNAPVALHDTRQILVRRTWTRAEVRAFHKARKKRAT